MRRPDFWPAGRWSIKRRKTIGPAFNRLLAPVVRAPRRGLPAGCLVHVDYVRLPARHYNELFVQGEHAARRPRRPPVPVRAPASQHSGLYAGRSGAVLLLIGRPSSWPDRPVSRTFRYPADHRPAFWTICPAWRKRPSRSRLLDAHRISCVLVGTTEDLLSRSLVLAAGVGAFPPSACSTD